MSTDLAPEELQALRTVFATEATENLDALAQALERLPGQHAAEAADGFATCLRLTHNLKGAAGMVGLEQAERLAHALEGAISRTRDGGGAPDGEFPRRLVPVISLLQRLVNGEDLGAAVAAAHATLAGAEANGARQGPDESPAPSRAPAAAGRPTTGAPETSVRVDVSRLDRLMARGEELLIARSRQAARHESLARLAADCGQACARLPPELRSGFADILRDVGLLVRQERAERLQFGHLIDDVSLAMKDVRMQPLAGLAAAWRSTVRETSAELGKETRLEVDVGGIELDRFVVDTLREPFIHLLRNAVDHGLETPEERVRAGKPRTGRIAIAASLKGSMVALEVSDDGRGLDAQAVGASAVRKGLVTAERLARMSTAEVLDLAFLPGCSTAAAVTRVSGRGVGLDVVRQRIEPLGGTAVVELPPRLGGATFALTVPMSILATRGLLVRIGGTLYAVPLDSVEGTRRVARDAVRRARGTAVIEDRGAEPLRLCWLDAVLGASRSPEPDRLAVLVLSRNRARLGVVVDEVLPDEDLVTRRLPWNFKWTPGVGGAVIRADGSVALVVDVAHLFSRSALAGEAERTARATARPFRVLVVDDSETARSMQRGFLVKAGYEVSEANDGAQAWQALQGQGIDLVVADVEMPCCDGFELTRRIRRAAELRHLPVMLVTKLGSAKDVAAGAAAGADEYLVKGGFGETDFLEAVERLTGRPRP